MNERVAHPLSADPAAYGTDVHAWTQAQAALLRARAFEAIDLDNIIEEIESLGNEQAHAVESHLIVAVEHLLKLAVSADQEPRRGWMLSVRNARNRIGVRLRKSPSLRPLLGELLADGWETARVAAISGLREAEEGLVPEAMPFTLAQVMDESFFPG
jgi:hypothetical protein